MALTIFYYGSLGHFWCSVDSGHHFLSLSGKKWREHSVKQYAVCSMVKFHAGLKRHEVEFNFVWTFLLTLASWDRLQGVCGVEWVWSSWRGSKGMFQEIVRTVRATKTRVFGQRVKNEHARTHATEPDVHQFSMWFPPTAICAFVQMGEAKQACCVSEVRKPRNCPESVPVCLCVC